MYNISKHQVRLNDLSVDDLSVDGLSVDDISVDDMSVDEEQGGTSLVFVCVWLLATSFRAFAFLVV